VFGPDERPPASNAAGRAARTSGGRRRFPLAVAVLVALASVPSVAVMLVGVASLDATPGSRSPFMAHGPEGPVFIAPDTQVRAGGRTTTEVQPADTVPSPRPGVPARPPARRGGPTPEHGRVPAATVRDSRAESCGGPASGASANCTATPTAAATPTAGGSAAATPTAGGSAAATPTAGASSPVRGTDATPSAGASPPPGSAPGDGSEPGDGSAPGDGSEPGDGVLGIRIR
jgi:hypothetical protein